MLTVEASDASGTFNASATTTTTAAMFSGYTDYANVPVGREVRAPSVVYYAGKLYKIGGYGYVSGTGAARAWVDIYDIATDTWTQGADMPGARYWIDCEEIDAKIYCAGGYLSSGQSTLYIYDIATNTWSSGAALPAVRYNYASVKLNGKYYVIGGYTSAVTNTMLAYDPVLNTWDSTLPSMSVARRYGHAGVIGGKIYVAGGYSTTYLDSVEVFDPAIPAWTAGTTMPSPWVNAADGVLYDRYLVLTGGTWSSTSGASNGALIYDAVLNQWNWLPLIDRLLYSAEGDGDGTHFWTVSGRMYDGTAWSNSPYTFLLDECQECEPVTTADFTWYPPIPNPGIPATFTGTADGTQPSFEWDFGDTGTGTGQVIEHTFALPDTYTVVMTATTCDAANSVVATHDVVVEEGPLAVITPLSIEATLCPDSQTQDEINVCNEGSQPLTWSIDGHPSLFWLSESPLSGSVAAGLCDVVTVMYDSTGLTAGIYTGTIEFITNDALHLEVPIDVTLNVAGPPTNPGFTYSPAVPIVGELVEFTGSADSIAPVLYSWDFGDGFIGSGITVTHAYADYGDFIVTMTAAGCGAPAVITDTVTVAPCYSFVNEHFEGAFPPTNWSVVNNGGTCVWTRNDAFATPRPNYAGGVGFAADADSDKCGSGTTMDTELRTMTLDLTGVHTATLEYMTSYNDIGTGGDFADVDVSIDNGATWTNILQWDADHSPNGPGELVSLDLTPFAGNSNVIVRYHYYLATYDWWWEVDQVSVVGCYIPGAVPDIAVTPLELSQELQANQTADQTFNIANNGFEWLMWLADVGCGVPVPWLSTTPTSGAVSALSDVDVTTTFDSTGLALGTYNTDICINSNDPDSPTVQIAATLVVTGTPDISVTPASLSASQYPDEVTTQALQVCNDGTAQLTWSLSEIQAALANIPGVTGVSIPVGAASIPDGLIHSSLGETGQPGNAPIMGIPAGSIRPEDIGDAWEIMAPLPSARVFNAVIAAGQYVYVIGGTSDAAGATPTATNFRYNTADNTWTTMTPMPASLAEIDGIAIGGLIYIPGSDPDNNTYVYDTVADTWSVIPANGGYAAPVQYQVVAIGTDLYVIGGIINSASTANVWILDTTAGTWSAGVPMQNTRTSFSAAAIDGNIYVAGGVAYPGFTPNMTAEMFNGTSWSFIAPVPNGGGAYTRWSYNADGMAPGALWLAAGRRDTAWAVLNHAGYYDTATDTWTDSPTIPLLNQGRVYMEGDVASDGYFYVIGGRDSAGAIVYANNERLMVYSPDVPWLSEAPTSGALMPAECVDVTVTFDSAGLVPDTYTAALSFASDDPDEPVVDVPVTLEVLVQGEPIIVVEPLALETWLLPDQTDILTMTISNEGTLDLSWALSEGWTVVGWSDNFDGYATGSSLHGQGGWKGWFNDPAATAYTSDLFAVSAPNSVRVQTTTDLVHEYAGYTSGVWTYTAMQYIPTDCAGETYFILLNQYNDAGADLNWSTQVDFDCNASQVINDGAAGGVLPMVKGQWVELKVVIDLTSDLQTFFYGGNLLFTDSWTDGMSGGGILNLAAVDLFANGASPVYYDDITLTSPSTDIPWLSEDPVSGITPPLGFTPVDVTFNSTGLTVGDYVGTLNVDSNDPVTPTIPIPVTLHVVEMGISLSKTVGTVPGVCATTDVIAVTPGTQVTYCFTVENTGSATFIMHSLFDDKLGQVLNHEPAILEPGGTLSHLVNATIITDTINTATWTAFINEVDFVEATDTATVTLVTADLAVAKQAPTSVLAGDTFTYTLTVENLGPDDAVDALLVDTLPDGVSVVSLPSACTIVGQVVTCDLGALYPPSAVAILNLVVTGPTSAGMITNTAVVSSASFDPDESNNTASTVTEVLPSVTTLRFYLPLIFK